MLTGTFSTYWPAVGLLRMLAHGVQASEVDVQPWGSFVTFSDPDGNTWALQQLPPEVIERLCPAAPHMRSAA